MSEFEEMLEKSVQQHGHLCPGQVIGVRMAILGRILAGISSFEKDIKKFVVYVGIDRCAADTIATVTGCKLGRRSLKFIDNGIMATTFLNLETGKAFRIAARESARDLVDQYANEEGNLRQRQVLAYQAMSDEELFEIREVKVKFDEETDMPGPTRKKVICTVCGETVRDGKEAIVDGLPYC